MSRRGMPKKGKNVPMPAHEQGEIDISGGEKEYTLGKDDVPIVLTRTDPNFDERERLAEELWNREKGEMEGLEPEEEEPKEPEVKTDDTDKSDDTDADTEAEEEAEEVEEEDKTVEGDGEKEEDRAEAIEEEYETLTIDGQKVQKPKNEIYEAGKRALQKDLSADKRLEEATRLLKETQATISARLPQDGVAHQRPLQPVPDKEQQAKIKQLYEKLRYGDDDEGEAAMTELLQGRTATPQIEEILFGVSRYIERERIRTVFTTPPDKGGYADIYPEEGGGKCTDPEIWEFFDYKVNQMINRGEPNELPTYQKAAEEVRKRFSASSSKPSLSDKKEKKRGIDVVKGVKTRSPVPETPKEETHEDILNEHRKARGLL